MKKIKTNDKQVLKINLQQATKTISSVVIAMAICLGATQNKPATTAHAITVDEAPPYQKQSQEITNKLLPSTEEVNSNLSRYFSNENIQSISRLALPKNSKPIKINFNFQTSLAEQNLFNLAVEEFNNIFAVINPAYRFETNFTPTNKDTESVYNINVNQVSSFENEKILGLATSITNDLSKEIDGKENYCNTIDLAQNAFTNADKLTTVFKHELMHILGADDLSGENIATIMENLVDNAFTHLTSNDVAFLSCLYKSTNVYNDYEIENYIDTYEINNAFSWSITKSATRQEFAFEVLHKHLTTCDIKDLIVPLQTKYPQSSLQEFEESLKKGNFETNFPSSTSMKELRQQNTHSALHKFAQKEENSMVIENFRDLDPSIRQNIYSFQTSFTNATTYKNIFGNDTIAYVYLGDYVLQIEYEICENGSVSISPQALFRQTNISKDDYSQMLTSEQQNIEQERKKELA